MSLSAACLAECDRRDARRRGCNRMDRLISMQQWSAESRELIDDAIGSYDRMTAWARKQATKHSPVYLDDPDRGTECAWCIDSSEDPAAWPCDEILDVAAALDVEVP